MFICINKKKIFIVLFFIMLIVLGIFIYKYKISSKSKELIAGANLHKVEMEKQNEKRSVRFKEDEKYFRPSNRPILNTNNEVNYDESSKNLSVPPIYMKTPEDTIVNYFSILREAANPIKGKSAGCGSLGNGNAPYKIAYEFLTNNYKNEMPFIKYEKSFQNILHINLIKFKQVEDNNNPLKYFYEIETIQGTEEGIGTFVYYYGFLNLKKEGEKYKIENNSIYAENYLCAPYHGWIYDGEAKVQIQYGGWCKLVKTMEKTEVNDYIKNVYFKGKDDKDYKIEFYILTNDYDIEVAQYIKETTGKWKRVELDPNKCLEKK